MLSKDDTTLDDVLRGIFVRREELPFLFTRSPHDVGFVVFQGVLHDGVSPFSFTSLMIFWTWPITSRTAAPRSRRTVEFGVSHLR